VINKKNAAASGKRGVRLRIFQQKNYNCFTPVFFRAEKLQNFTLNCNILIFTFEKLKQYR